MQDLGTLHQFSRLVHRHLHQKAFNSIFYFILYVPRQFQLMYKLQFEGVVLQLGKRITYLILFLRTSYSILVILGVLSQSYQESYINDDPVLYLKGFRALISKRTIFFSLNMQVPECLHIPKKNLEPFDIAATSTGLQ